jgi:Sel1 repeat
MSIRFFIYILCCLSATSFALPSIKGLYIFPTYIREGEPVVTIVVDGSNEPQKCHILLELSAMGMNNFKELKVVTQNKAFPLFYDNVIFTGQNTLNVRVKGIKTNKTPACLGGASKVIYILPSNAPASLLAKLNNAESESLFQKGNSFVGIGQDVVASRYFYDAAGLGHAKAMNALGYMYQEGKGVTQDYKEAHTWFYKAIQNGSMDAAIHQGILFKKGLGSPVDLTIAYTNFAVAAQLADDEEQRGSATKLRDELEPKLTEDQISRANNLVKNFIQNEQIRRQNLP